jgi:hypothetical protein
VLDTIDTACQGLLTQWCRGILRACGSDGGRLAGAGRRDRMNLLIDIRLPNEGDRTNRDSMPRECVESPGPVQAIAAVQDNPAGVCA